MIIVVYVMMDFTKIQVISVFLVVFHALLVLTAIHAQELVQVKLL